MTEGALATEAASKRVPAIDGLRGLAALMILGQHLSITENWYANRLNVTTDVPIYLFPQRPWTSVQTFVEWSPLHMIYASNAIYIFFIVSGFILVNSVRNFKPRAYALGRVTRLYVPVIASAVPALILAQFYMSHVRATTSFWLNLHIMSVHWQDVIGVTWLLDNHLDLNSALWTMPYEILFSLVLPVLLWKVSDPAKGNRRHYVRLAALVAMSCVGVQFGFVFLTYMPVFFIGVVLSEIPPLRRGHLWALAVGVVLMNLVWTAGGFHVRIDRFTFTVSTLVGAALVVHAVRGWGVPSRLLSSTPAQFIGRRSFSIYLLHVPVIYFVWLSISVSSGLRGELIHLAIALVMLFAMVELFYRVVERRALSWSRTLARRLQGELVADVVGVS